MNKLEECRTKIDELDTKIIELYEERMNIVKQVIEYKLENNLPILDANRETSMLNKNLNKIKCVELQKYYQDVLKGFLKASKDMQKDILENHNK